MALTTRYFYHQGNKTSSTPLQDRRSDLRKLVVAALSIETDDQEITESLRYVNGNWHFH